MMVNEGLPLTCCNDCGRPRSSEMTVGILGMAFKAASDDIRSSLSYKLKRSWPSRPRVLCTDPYVTRTWISCPWRRSSPSPTLIVVGAPHRAVPECGRRPIADVWGILGGGVQNDGRPRVSIIIPAYEEGEDIVACLDRIFAAVSWPCEVAVVVDSSEDVTVPVLADYAKSQPQFGRWSTPTAGVRPTRSGSGSTTPTLLSSSSRWRTVGRSGQIEPLCRLVERGVVVAAASRYARGGQQVGGPFVKSLMSKTAGRSLYTFARIGTRDATNSFKAYDRKFVQDVGIDSRRGFEIGLELTVKAKRLGLPIAELPTIWLERNTGVSNFKDGPGFPSICSGIGTRSGAG